MYHLSYVFFSRVSKSAGPNTCPGDFLSGTFTLSKNDLVKKKVCTCTLLLVPYKGSDCSLMREERAMFLFLNVLLFISHYLYTHNMHNNYYTLYCR